MLIGALGLAGEDLRRQGTRASAAMVGSIVCPTGMGDGRTTRERAAQVTGTQVSSAGSEGARRGRRWGEDTARQLDEHAVGKEGGYMSGHTASGG